MKPTFRCLLESIVYTLLILFLFYFLPYTKKDFLNLNLHPLFVLVALMSLRYGIYLGILSAFIAISGYLYAYLHSGHDMILFLLQFQYYKFFLMFLFVAMILGRFQKNYKNREEEIEFEMDKMKLKLDEEQKQRDQLLDINLGLKEQIIKSQGSIVAFHHLKKQLFGKNLEESYENILKIIETLLNCKETSIYLFKRKEKIEKSFSTSNNRIKEELLLPSKEGEKFLKVFQEKIPLKFLAENQKNGFLYIAPLIKKKDIMGFIVVNCLSCKTGEKYNFELFKVLLQEIHGVFDRGESYEI